jgi:hypothetical protein
MMDGIGSRETRDLVKPAFASFLLLAFFAAVPLAAEKEEQAVKAPARVSVEKGQVVVVLSPAEQKRADIVIARLKFATYSEQLHAYGAVIGPQALNEVKNAYVTAVAQCETARTRAVVSGREFERLKALNEDYKNVSDKVLEAAEADWQVSTIAARAAADRVSLVESGASQQWGPVIAGWLTTGSPEFERLLGGKSLLLQVTLPQGGVLSRAPQRISVENSEGKTVYARLVSPSPRTDPRIQGLSFFYLVDGSVSLFPGMNVVAAMPAGPPVRGVLIPPSAVVWSEDKAWVYVRRSEDQFVQTEVSATYRVKGGYFVTRGFNPGDQVVVKGAQLLLSEQSRSQIQEGGD